MAKTDFDKLKGVFTGRLDVRMDDEGVLMTLLAPFGFVDCRQVEWPVPQDAKTDGASIPRLLWTVVGSPFTGKYRKAAVVHDYYCDVRSRASKDVHRMFFEAMLTAGVNQREAKTLYLGVLFGGPKWNEQAIHNTLISMLPGLGGVGPGAGFASLGLVASPFNLLRGAGGKTRMVQAPSPELTEERLAELVELAGDDAIDLDQMESLVEQARDKALV